MMLRFRLVILILLVLTFTACLKSPIPFQKSQLTILGMFEGPLAPEITDAQFVVSRGKHSFERTVPVSNNQFDITFQLPMGQWEVKVFLLDSNGMIHFQNTPEEVQVVFGQANFLELVLRPADSEIHVEIDLDDYIFKDLALRARVFFNDEIFEVIRPDVLTPLETVITVQPGSYEFKVELFTDSFRAGDRLGPGLWKILDVPSNEVVTVTWTPHTGQLQIKGYLETMLPAPNNLHLEKIGDEIHLIWDPIFDQNLIGYFVLVQNNPLERYELLTATPTQLEEFRHTFNFEEHSSQLNYVVAGVSKSGRVGYYSQPISCFP